LNVTLNLTKLFSKTGICKKQEDKGEACDYLHKRLMLMTIYWGNI